MSRQLLNLGGGRVGDLYADCGCGATLVRAFSVDAFSMDAFLGGRVLGGRVLGGRVLGERVLGARCQWARSRGSISARLIARTSLRKTAVRQDDADELSLAVAHLSGQRTIVSDTRTQNLNEQHARRKECLCDHDAAFARGAAAAEFPC